MRSSSQITGGPSSASRYIGYGFWIRSWSCAMKARNRSRTVFGAAVAAMAGIVPLPELCITTLSAHLRPRARRHLRPSARTRRPSSPLLLVALEDLGASELGLLRVEAGVAEG